MTIHLITGHRWRVAALALTMLLPSAGTSIANVALPTLATAFGATSQDVQWVVIAYLLATTTIIVAGIFSSMSTESESTITRPSTATASGGSGCDPVAIRK